MGIEFCQLLLGPRIAVLGTLLQYFELSIHIQIVVL